MIGDVGKGCVAQSLAAAELSKRLIVSQAALRGLLASAPVVTLDMSGQVLSMAEPICAMFQADPIDAPGKPFSDFVKGFDVSAVRPSGQAGAPADDAPGRHWIGARGKDGTFPLDISAAMIPEADGADAFIVLSLVDLTRLHDANARARELDGQLNHVWRLNSLGEMAAVLAHELNQPLTAATAYIQASQADLGKAGIMGDSASRTIELAKGQILRAGKIIRRMRNLLSTGAHSLQTERVSSMVDELDPIFAMLGADSGIAVRTQIEIHSDTVLAERIQFQQAMVNLVRNAIEAVETKPAGEVVVSGRPLSAEFYEVSVEDNGPGIAPDHVSRIFQPMTTTKTGGMGLGLSVTRHIVDLHGGALAVRPSKLGGAAFHFSLKRDGVAGGPS